MRHEGYWTQVHAQDPHKNKLVSRELLFGEDQFVKWAKTFNGKANLYFGRNARTKTGEIACINAFTLDIDPERPKDTASTSEEHSRAIKVARNISERYGNGIVCSSGNGAFLIFPFDKPVEGDLETFGLKGKYLEEEIRKQFETNLVRVDSTYDLQRMARVLGSTNVKGNREQWRYARFLDKPVFFRRRSSKILERLQQIIIPKSTFELPSFKSGDYPSRSEADYGLAARLQQSGLGPEDCYQALLKYSHRGREDDARRIVTKIYSRQVSGYTQSGGETKPLELFNARAGFAEYLRELEQRGQEAQNRIITGFRELDEKLYELPRGEISTFAARSGYGKTSFACCLSNHLRVRGKRVLFFSTEVNRLRIIDKLISVDKSIPFFELTSGKLSQRSRELIREYGNEIGNASIYICDNSNPSIEQVRGKIDEIKPDVFIFDHINWIASERTAIREYFKALKDIANNFGITGVVFAQLNEPPRDLKNGGFMDSDRSDIRESKDLITDSAVLVIWQNEGMAEGPIQKVKVKVAKGRYGGMDEEFYLQVDKRYGRFEPDETHT